MEIFIIVCYTNIGGGFRVHKTTQEIAHYEYP